MNPINTPETAASVRQYIRRIAPNDHNIWQAWLALTPIISAARVKSVVDFGCNAGAWLAACDVLGATDLVGVDYDLADYPSAPELFGAGRVLLTDAPLIQHDLSTPLDFGRWFDLAICVEVAEHLDGGDATADILVNTITNHAKMVIFSAATPGQGGHHHVNCQPHEYWHERFAKRGFAMRDAFRPLLHFAPQVDAWYRENLFLYMSL
jgi:SAM-dependent methyltransferase